MAQAKEKAGAAARAEGVSKPPSEAPLPPAHAPEQSELEKKISEVEEAYGTKCQDNPNFADEVIEKVHNNNRLTDSLLDQQKANEARVGSLKAELVKMQQELEDVQLGGAAGESSGAGNTSTVLSSRQVRSLDEKTFKAEIRCNQNLRRADKANRLIQSCKTGLQHLGKLILHQEEADLLPPKIPGVDATYDITWDDINLSNDSNEAMLKLLAGCEYHVSRVREALSVGKQLDETKDPKMQGHSQEDEAHLMGLTSGGGGSAARSSRRPRRSGEEPDDTGASLMTGVLIEKHKREVRVPSKSSIDGRYVQAVQERLAEADARADKNETLVVPSRDANDEVETFLAEALGTTEARAKQRRANMLSQRRQGAAAPRGLAVDHILRQNQQALLAGPSRRTASTKLQSTAGGLVTPVLERTMVKASSSNVVNREKRLERKRQQKKEAMLKESMD